MCGGPGRLTEKRPERHIIIAMLESEIAATRKFTHIFSSRAPSPTIPRFDP
jgi:hypothetical protein